MAAESAEVRFYDFPNIKHALAEVDRLKAEGATTIYLKGHGDKILRIYHRYVPHTEIDRRGREVTVWRRAEEW